MAQNATELSNSTTNGQNLAKKQMKLWVKLMKR